MKERNKKITLLAITFLVFTLFISGLTVATTRIIKPSFALDGTKSITIKKETTKLSNEEFEFKIKLWKEAPNVYFLLHTYYEYYGDGGSSTTLIYEINNNGNSYNSIFLNDKQLWTTRTTGGDSFICEDLQCEQTISGEWDKLNEIKQLLNSGNELKLILDGEEYDVNFMDEESIYELFYELFPNVLSFDDSEPYFLFYPATKHFDLSSDLGTADEDGYYHFNLNNGGSKIIENIPIGYEYEIEELTPEGWKLVSINNDTSKTKVSDTVSEDSPTEYTFKNKSTTDYNLTVETKYIDIEKVPIKLDLGIIDNNSFINPYDSSDFKWNPLVDYSVSLNGNIDELVDRDDPSVDEYNNTSVAYEKDRYNGFFKIPTTVDKKNGNQYVTTNLISLKTKNGVVYNLNTDSAQIKELVQQGLTMEDFEIAKWDLGLKETVSSQHAKTKISLPSIKRMVVEDEQLVIEFYQEIKISSDIPKIEKYINNDVHLDKSLGQRFTYSILAYVPNGADGVIIADDVNENIVIVSAQDQIVVEDLGTDNDSTPYGTVMQSGKTIEEASPAIDGALIQVDIPNVEQYQSHWIKVSFDAMIKSDLDINNYTKVPVSDNGNVLSDKSHEGISNMARMSTFSNHDSIESDSNVVTVSPEPKTIRVVKEWLDEYEGVMGWPDEIPRININLVEIIGSNRKIIDTVKLESSKYEDTFTYYAKDGATYEVEEEPIDGYIANKKKRTINNQDIYTITNTVRYNATGKITLTANKTLSGKTLTANQFEFEVKEGNNVVATGKNNASGNITFSDINYTQEDVGEHTYVVSEKGSAPSGYTYASPKTIKVRVTDNGDGTLTATRTDTLGNLTFANTYKANGSFSLTAKKTLSGKTIAANQFEFEVKEGSTVKATGKNDANGNITFTTINYTQADVGEHTYVVSEKGVAPSGYTYANPQTIKVRVVDNGNGTLSATRTDTLGNLTFANSYKASGSVTLEATKVLNKGTLRGGEFSFELREGSSVKQTKTNGANGKVTFDSISYSASDIGTKTYTIVEVNPNKTYYSHDAHTETVTVTITDNGDGTLKATPSYDSDGAKFTNTYSAAGSITFTGTKVLTGRTLENNQFEFEVKEGSTVVATGKNNAAGTITFSKINYTESDIGTHTYKITEKNSGKAGYTYSTNEETVTVKVEDNYDGTLKVTPTYDADGIKFTNTYKASGYLDLKLNKTLTGKTIANEQFSFELKENNVLKQIKRNNASGVVTFDRINYTETDIGKTYTYTITEKGTAPSGYTYDTKTETIKVVVQDNGNGTLTPNVTGNTNPTFANSYKAEGSVVLKVNKTLTNGTLKAGEFAFDLYDSTGNIIQENKTNDASGEVVFSPITYKTEDIGKTYKYTVKERATGKTYYEEDTHTETINVKVEDNYNGTLKTTPTYSNSGKFTNVYKASGSVVLDATKSLTGRTLEDKQFTFELKNSEGNVIDTKKNNADGSITFNRITYNETDIGKTYTYKIVEKQETKAGYTLDKTEKEVKVVVTDNYNGTLKATPTYTNGKAFTNTYKANGSIVLDVDKVLTGRVLAKDQFSFELKDTEGRVLQTKKNDESGKVVFDKLNYTEKDAGKTYTYTISEVNDEKAGYTYDERVETVKVVVTDNGNGTLKAEIENKHDIIFNNLYNAKGSAVLELSKEYINGTLTGGEFAFFIKDESGEIIQTVTNDEEGRIVFSPIEYKETDASKTYKYKIDEIIDEDPLIDYDKSVKEAEVSITDNGDGTLKTDIVFKAEDSVFKNTKKGKVVVSKEDIAGSELEGAKIVITDSEGKEVDSWVSTKEKHETILYAGEYTLTETASPDGYEKAESVVFSIGVDGKVIVGDSVLEEIVMKDEYTKYPIKISKQDIDGKELLGAQIQIIDNIGNVIDSWSSDGSNHEISLPFGTYILHEEVAPSGYQVTTDITFEITRQGKIRVRGKNVKAKDDLIILINDEIPKSPQTGIGSNISNYVLFTGIITIILGLYAYLKTIIKPKRYN